MRHIKSWIETRITVLASGLYASLSVKQFDTHCPPNENTVMETGGRKPLVIGRSKVNLKKMLIFQFDYKQICKSASDGD